MDGFHRPEPGLPDGPAGRWRGILRPASAVLAVAMLVAIFSVHIGNGLFMSNNGYEFGLALLAVSVSLLFSGAGRASVDALLAKQ